MKIFLLASLASLASAGVSPELSLSISDGSFGDVPSALTPKLSVGGDVSGIQIGAQVDVGLDLMGAPKSLFASKSASVAGWNLKAKAEYSQGKYEYPNDANRGVYLSVEANDEDETAFGWVSGDASSSGVAPLKVGAKKIFETGVGKFMVEPRLRFYKGTTDEGADLCLGYQRDETDTQVYLTASMGDQNVKLVQNINEDNTASLKYGRSAGFLYAKVENNSDMGRSTLTVTKDDLDLQLEQDGWKAGMKLGYPLQKAEPQVRFSKKFSVGKE